MDGKEDKASGIVFSSEDYIKELPNEEHRHVGFVIPVWKNYDEASVGEEERRTLVRIKPVLDDKEHTIEGDYAEIDVGDPKVMVIITFHRIVSDVSEIPKKEGRIWNRL